MTRLLNRLSLATIAIVLLVAATTNNPMVDILRFRGGPTMTSGSGAPEGSVTASPGSVFLRTNGAVYRKVTGTGNTGWGDIFDRTLRRGWATSNAANLQPSIVGFPSVTTSGAMTDASDANSVYTSFSQGAIGSLGWTPAGALGLTTFEGRHDPYVYIDLKTGADITDLRLWMGLSSASFLADDGGTAHYVAFRFSTTAGDTGWRGAVSNGAAVNQQLTANIGTVAASTRYQLIAWVSGTVASFSVNGSAPVTLSTNVPTSGTMGPIFNGSNLANETKAISFGHFYVESR